MPAHPIALSMLAGWMGQGGGGIITWLYFGTSDRAAGRAFVGLQSVAAFSSWADHHAAQFAAKDRGGQPQG